MGSGPLLRLKDSSGTNSTGSRVGSKEAGRGKKPPSTSGVKGSKPVANDPDDCGAVEGRVISGLPIRVCNNSPSPGKPQVVEKQDVAMAGKGEDAVATVVVMGASVSLYLGSVRGRVRLVLSRVLGNCQLSL